MLARGDQVTLPHGKGIGLVIDNEGGDVGVFVGSKADGTPIIDRYVECELSWTGRHLAKPARDVAQRIKDRKLERGRAVVSY